MAQDKTQFGLTEANQIVINEIDRMDLFQDQAEIAKFAMAVAIAKRIQLGTVTGAETKWHAGGFDKTGEIADLVATVYPDTDTPYRAVEFLVNKGLEILEEHLRKNQELDLISLLADPVSAESKSD